MTIFSILFLIQVAGPARPVAPVLEFPEPGMDDPAAYEGYRTRFLRDAHGNAFQVYIDRRDGRIVHVWANAANESVGFTARDAGGRPAALVWGGAGATVVRTGRSHGLEYDLEAGTAELALGFFLLGSMRVERDFQYRGGHRRPWGAPSFRQVELEELVGNIERLDAVERDRHLALLGAADPDELRARLRPVHALDGTGSSWVIRVEQPAFDGRNRLAIEIAVDRRAAAVEISDDVASIRSLGGRPLRLQVRVTTDARPLTPLAREEIFNGAFLRFHAEARDAHDRALARAGPGLAPAAGAPPAAGDSAGRKAILRFRWLERQVRSAELLSYREKLMAGMPNYATYFGRDMLMTALMMEPVWAEGMREHVIAGVLRKLSPAGEVSHEEALGGQAVRENAAACNALLADYFRGGRAADTLLARAREVLADLRAVREDYRMLDDDFQLPVLVARYLADPRVPAARKREFLLAPARPAGGASRLELLLRNLSYVARRAEPYAREPEAGNLVGFPRRDAMHWFAGSWRDSGPGYANGRFAMDINTIWVPRALESIAVITAALRELGVGSDGFHAGATADPRTVASLSDSAALRRAIAVWRDARRHFVVRLAPDEAHGRIRTWLDGLPAAERRYWERVVRSDPLGGAPLEFLALSLDSAGRPIPVAGTDPATRLFLEDLVGGPGEDLTGPDQDGPDRALRDLRVFLLPYPVGLFIEGVGPVATNDAYAPSEVQEAYRDDPYHSPKTVWGREVNLLLLGLARQIDAAHDASGALVDPALAPVVRDLSAALRQVLVTVEDSGLKHNELWSYRIADGALSPVRYGTSTDIQLWNVTDLAVQFRLARLPAVVGPVSAPAWSAPAWSAPAWRAPAWSAPAVTGPRPAASH